MRDRLSRRLFLSAAVAAVARAEGADWPDDRKESFLQTAKIIDKELLASGTTGTVKLTLSLDSFQHDAHFQSVDRYYTASSEESGGRRDAFRDSYLFNLAAYRLSRAIGLANVPVCVERMVAERLGALAWWVDDVLLSEADRYRRRLRPPDAEAWNRQIHAVRVFDELIFNADRNLGNLLIDASWRVWMIDHTRAFRITPELRHPERLLRCPRRVYDALRALSQAKLQELLGRLLLAGETAAVLARRDRIVELFEQRIEQAGEEQALFDL